VAQFQKIISTIDSHTAGESTRLVVNGLPPIRGRTVAEKLAYAQEHLAWVPGFLMREPRGHNDMFGAVLLPPCVPEADAAVIFMDNQGYEPMCGHAIIGIVTSLIETGVVGAMEPETRLTLDTAAGFVRAFARVQRGQVESVSFDNVPAFVFRQNAILSLPDLGPVAIDVAFGGNFFALVDARRLGVELIPTQTARLVDWGMRILQAANDAVAVSHPELPHIDRIIDLRFYTEPGSEGANSRNAVVLGDHMLDRSPCGTGTCAEMALRYARGQLSLGEPFVVESILGTRFTGQVMAEAQVGRGSSAFPAIIPRVTGSAYVTGLHQFVLQCNDPFPQGFCLKA
jgi:proline racemase